MLVSAGGAGFAYDPLNRLYRQDASGTVVRYAGEDAVMEPDTAGTVRRRFVPGDGADEPLVWYEGSGTGDRRWFHQDERGSVVAVTNPWGQGSILTYDEYGIPGAGNTAVGSRFGYTGQTWLPEAGLYHYKARAYSPTLGRFLQADPIGYADGMNMYAYVGNDPVNKVDPSGLIVQQDIIVKHERLGPCETDPFSCLIGGGGLSGNLAPPGRGVTGSGGAPGGANPAAAKAVTPPQKEQQCALEADRLGRGAGTVAAATITGAQGGPVGALAGLGIGVGVVLAQDLLPEKFGSLIDSAGGAASGGVYGFLSSQYDRVFKSVFSNAPGVAQIGGGAVANVAQHVIRTGALTGAVGAARWGAAAGVGYLG